MPAPAGTPTRAGSASIMPDQTATGCAALCDADPSCLAFEFGVPCESTRKSFMPALTVNSFSLMDCDETFRAFVLNLRVFLDGGDGGYQDNDCQLQDAGAEAATGCDGAHYNLDLYAKEVTKTLLLAVPQTRTLPLSCSHSRVR